MTEPVTTTPPRWTEYVPLDDIKRHPDNPKRHAAADIEASVTRFGYTEAVLVCERTGLLAAGHGRLDELERARSAGEDPPEGVTVDAEGRWCAPVQRGWASKDDAELRAYLVASNRLTEKGGWDEGDLASILDELRTSDPLDGLSGVGFTSDELDKLLVNVRAHQRGVAESDPEDVPPVPVEPKTKAGDLWLLGHHRLLCGDATSEAAHDVVMGSYAGVDLVLTDPPYGVGIDYGPNVSDDDGDIRALIAVVMPLLTVHPAVLLTPGVNCMWAYPPPAWLLGWVHPASTSSGPWGFNSMNPILAYGKDPYLAAGLGRRSTALVLAADREGENEHPVAKPIKVWSWLLERGCAKPERVVLDPFMGSGTTLIACEMAGHTALGIELEPRWVDVACARWQRFTGSKPILAGTGQAHDFCVPVVPLAPV